MKARKKLHDCIFPNAILAQENSSPSCQRPEQLKGITQDAIQASQQWPLQARAWKLCCSTLDSRAVVRKQCGTRMLQIKHPNVSLQQRILRNLSPQESLLRTHCHCPLLQLRALRAQGQGSRGRMFKQACSSTADTFACEAIKRFQVSAGLRMHTSVCHCLPDAKPAAFGETW